METQLSRWILLAILFSTPAACKGQVTPQPCTGIVFDGDQFTACAFEPQTQTLRLVWKDAAGVAYRSFSALARDVKASDVAFAMNAGMFDDQGGPIGLYVESGQELRSLNSASGSGNFYMRPNGVFWVDDAGEAHVTETAAYLRARPSPAWASQSGPMLVLDGSLHPDIRDDGPSRFVRNGVGVECLGSTVFVISEKDVSFGKFARVFRDELGCRNALYFDGYVSSLWASSVGRMDARAPLGPMVIVETK